MTLLHALKSLSQKHKWKIIVAHFNHRLRGRTSDLDEKFVRKTAVKLKLPIVVESADVKSFAKKSKLSIEMAARKLRHEFFARTAKARKIKTIALAHHADDQVELFFLRLLRGTGSEGLSGMKWKTSSPSDKTISLIRPLLDFSKTELAEFARENKIQFHDDATNFSNDFLRNRIRNQLLPLLRKNYQPSLNKTVLRFMEIVGAESDFVVGFAKNWKKNQRLNFVKFPTAIQRRILQSQLLQQNVPTDFNLIEQLRRSPKQFVSAGSNLSVARNEFGEIQLRAESKPEFNANEFKLDLTDKSGKMIFGGKKFLWKIVGDSRKRSSYPKNSGAKNRIEFFDADKIGNQIILRHWRAGDRFQPIGLKSAVKLQDFFVNAKIPRARRHNLVLATTESGEIFWVEDLRISENFKITPPTKRQLLWKWSKLAV